LHDVVVDRRAGGLDDEDIAAAHVLVDAGPELAVRKALERELAERIAEALGDLLRQRHIGPAAEHLEHVFLMIHGCRPCKAIAVQDQPDASARASLTLRVGASYCTAT